MKRYDIINLLIAKYHYKHYLEIGIALGECFREINCELKHSVDPASFPVSHKMTSDEFFEKNTFFYDIIFLDGLHLSEQITKDISNSLSFLRPKGTIVVHDCLPIDERHQGREYTGNAWTGDVWKGFAEFRFTRPDLSMVTVDCDWGCGIIQHGKQDVLPKPAILDWEYFCKNKNILMNIMTEEQWKYYLSEK